jgi:hypothetical protein
MLTVSCQNACSLPFMFTVSLVRCRSKTSVLIKSREIENGMLGKAKNTYSTSVSLFSHTVDVLVVTPCSVALQLECFFKGCFTTFQHLHYIASRCRIPDE